jgi:uncharacterized ubiquitin-like protein YukD
MINKIAALTATLVFITSTTFAIKRYTLDELKENPKFEVTVNANGHYSGNSIDLKIKSTHKKNVELIIPAGTVFYTSDEGDQILIVPEEQLLVITKGRTKKKTIDGFCSEASDGVPGNEMAMTFMPTKREPLQRLADFINENKGFNDHEIQEAVWCVSDSQSLANIYSEDRKKSEKLTKFVAELTGQEVTWHKVKRSHGQSGGRIQVNPILVTGMVHFSTTKKITMKSKIVDKDGKTVYENPQSMPVPKMDHVEMDFNLSVSGWSKGTYFVVYYDEDNNTILKKEFEI